MEKINNEELKQVTGGAIGSPSVSTCFNDCKAKYPIGTSEHSDCTKSCLSSWPPEPGKLEPPTPPKAPAPWER